MSESSVERTLPFRRREDLAITEVKYRGESAFVVKDPCRLKYFQLRPEQAAVLDLLGRQRSIEELRMELARLFPTLHITNRDVQSLVHDLHAKGLLLTDRLGQGVALVRRGREELRKKFVNVIRNPLYIRLPGWDPDRLLRVLQPWMGWLFHPLAMLSALGLVLFSLVFVAIRFDELLRKLPTFQQFFVWPNLLYLWLTLAVTKILHEFGHGLACKKCGGECHSMGVMILVFSPTLYCDATDSWTFKNKWRRILVAGAGMYVEVILASIAILLWWHARPGLVQNLCLNVFFVSTVTTVIFNANPLLRYDGYFMLSDFLEIPNLREKSSRLLQHAFANWCLGIELPTDAFMPKTGKGWFILYAILSALYRWLVLFGITLFLYTVLKPYRLEAIGITLAVVSIGMIIGNLIWSVWKIVTMPRNQPMSKRKLAVTLGILGLTIAAIGFIPFPWYIDAAFIVEPAGVRHIYTQAAGMLTVVHVQPGTEVEAGELLVQLENEELADECLRLAIEIEAQRAEREMYRDLDDAEGMLLAEARERSLQEQLDEAERQLSACELAAPVSGIVVAAAATPAAEQSGIEDPLPHWHGTPLDIENLAAYLEPRTHVCSIAPESAYQAVLLVDQEDLEEVSVGREVRLKIELLPGSVHSSTVTEISDRNLQHCPPALSIKYGGPIATTTGPDGHEQLTSDVFQAIVPLNVEPELLRSGMRGEARIVVGHRSLAGWIWRWLRTTFRFRL